ncbi:AraC family transcriptional regulator [Treponema primitia]|uniref:helix-turn-helix domain-containing protein n=1 Tax=Treponema primitia TaxID=88058 RepID=UPI00397E9DDE
MPKPWDSFLHYLPYSTEDERFGMVCTTAGSANILPNTVYPPRITDHPLIFRQVAVGRTLPEFQIVYITKGQGILTVDETSYTVTPGSLFLLLPGIKHRYKPVYEIGWQEYWVGFNGDYFTKLFRDGILSREHIFFKIGLQEYILSYFNRIFDEIRAQQPLYQLRACTQVFSLLGEMLVHERRKEQPGSYQKIVEKAKYLMESNIYGAINLSNISEQIGTSTSRLHEIFKNYTSMTPYQYYIQIKINKAESLLEQDISVKEVAYRLGFEDQSYFSRLFKKKTGIAPSEWKKYIYA